MRPNVRMAQPHGGTIHFRDALLNIRISYATCFRKGNGWHI
jgi:hypothetical protein